MFFWFLMVAELLMNHDGYSYAATAHLQTDCNNNSPVSLVLLLARVLKRSVRGARMPSMVPNMVLRPKLSSIRKKSADQKGLPGSMDMASVNAMKARPVPSTPCKQTRVFKFHLSLSACKEKKTTGLPSAFLFPGRSLLKSLLRHFHTSWTRPYSLE